MPSTPQLKGIPYLTRAQVPSTVLDAGIEFDVLAPYSGCYLCGEVFQSRLDLLYYQLASSDHVPDYVLQNVQQRADARRRLWRVLHSSTHSQSEHTRLAQSPDLMTPEAAMKLAPLGVIPLEFTEEMDQALQEAPRVPDAHVRHKTSEGRLSI